MPNPSGSTFAGWPTSQPKTCARCGKRVLQSQSHQVSVTNAYAPKGPTWTIRHLNECP